ncbi:hypothetical protein [Pedobacter sp. JY14-1]|uniref:hypothetical protein n=1 Tax=Pedobacter sp. JY14-1 TaxID=3034151 RepID=UPI0023E30D71|nr:hypothetical protein [Pedobacter sp. JY14-1]
MKAKFLSLAVTMIVFIASSAAAQTPDIVGTWRLVSQKITHPEGGVTTADSAALNQIKVYTPTMFVNIGERKIPQLDNQKLVVSCAGGHYSIKGDVYEEFTEFASYAGYKDMKVRFKLTMEKGKMHTVGSLSGANGAATIYDEWYSKVDLPAQGNTLTGTWKAISQKVTNPDGSVFTADSAAVSMRKMFTPGMVIVISERIIPQANNEKLVVSCAGGPYSLQNGVYEEFIDFASYKDYKNMKAKFNLKIEDNQLHTTGTLTSGNNMPAIYDERFTKVE